MKITKFKYFIFYTILLVLPLSFVAISSYFIPVLNNIALKTYYIYYGGMSLSFTSIFIILMTNFFIKNNFPKTSEEIDNTYLLKTNLIFIIFHLIITIISNVLNYYQIANYFIYALYLFYPLIYFCIILFLDSKKINQKNVITILISIYLLWYLLVPLLSFLITNHENLRSLVTLKSLLYNLLYNYLRYSLLVLPFMSLGLLKISKENKEKSMVHKYSFSIKKLFIIAMVLLFIAIAILLLLN